MQWCLLSVFEKRKLVISRITAPVPGLWLSASSNTLAKPSCPSLPDSIEWTSFTSSLFCCWSTVRFSTDHSLCNSSEILSLLSCVLMPDSLALQAKHVTLDDACCLSLCSSSSKLFFLSWTTSTCLLASLHLLHMSHILSCYCAYLRAACKMNELNIR